MKIHYVANPALFSFSVGSQILFDHSQKIMYMKPEDVLREYLYLSSSVAQEKDQRKGVAMGLTPEKQARLEILKSYIEGAVSLLQTATKICIGDVGVTATTLVPVGELEPIKGETGVTQQIIANGAQLYGPVAGRRDGGVEEIIVVTELPPP